MHRLATRPRGTAASGEVSVERLAQPIEMPGGAGEHAPGCAFTRSMRDLNTALGCVELTIMRSIDADQTIVLS